MTKKIEVTVEVYENQLEATFVVDGDVIRFLARDFTDSRDPDKRDWQQLVTALTESVNEWRRGEDDFEAGRQAVRDGCNRNPDKSEQWLAGWDYEASKVTEARVDEWLTDGARRAGLA